jgi:phenylpyruvate tautomerase PptA (4-oxalocrotonate tautomerase family)
VITLYGLAHHFNQLRGLIMPIQIIATEGVIPVSAERELFAAVTDTFLKLHSLNDNTFMTPNVIGEISIVPKGRTFSGGKPTDIVIVELKTPSFALDSIEQKVSFVADVTDAVVKATGGAFPKDHIFVNQVHAIDGVWGIGGKAYTNADLGEAIQNAARSE